MSSVPPPMATQVVSDRIEDHYFRSYEYSLGIPYQSFRPDAIDNTIFLNPDMRAAYRNQDWSLLPSREDLRLLCRTLDQDLKRWKENGSDRTEIMAFNSQIIIMQIFPDQRTEFSYRLLPLHWARMPFHIHREVQHGEPPVYEAYNPSRIRECPFPPIQCHVHPLLVVICTARKRRYAQLPYIPDDYAADLKLLTRIFKTHMSTKIPDGHPWLDTRAATEEMSSSCESAPLALERALVRPLPTINRKERLSHWSRSIVVLPSESEDPMQLDEQDDTILLQYRQETSRSTSNAA
ncbi:hypothetical protein EIP91_005314 [Steccherinum ochraceum]|uniref:Uncharacterized protein n=1 Tax=Steccherinum ochraceum TaxID=92696 RepID=A0A4R0RA55_9APHY|nr:hypothetical protein EIP91_005314 [Steccherinum ochraceum]